MAELRRYFRRGVFIWVDRIRVDHLVEVDQRRLGDESMLCILLCTWLRMQVQREHCNFHYGRPCC